MISRGASNDGCSRAAPSWCVSKHPFLDLDRLAADHPFESGNPRLVFLNEIGSSAILVEGTGLELGYPDPDQIARDVVTLGKPCSVSPANKSPSLRPRSNGRWRAKHWRRGNERAEAAFAECGFDRRLINALTAFGYPDPEQLLLLAQGADVDHQCRPGKQRGKVTRL